MLETGGEKRAKGNRNYSETDSPSRGFVLQSSGAFEDIKLSDTGHFPQRPSWSPLQCGIRKHGCPLSLLAPMGCNSSGGSLQCHDDVVQIESVKKRQFLEACYAGVHP